MTDAADLMTIDIEVDPKDIISLVQHEPKIVIMNPEKRTELYAHIQREIDATPVDIATKKGRDEIRSLAAKIARTKTTVDKAGKEMNTAARAAIDSMNKIRGEIETRLQDLQDTARAPLTKWEDADKQRMIMVESAISELRNAHVIPENFKPEDIADRIEILKETIFAPEKFQEQGEQAELLRNAAVGRLVETHARMVKDIADKAELEKLRAEAERRRIEDEAREAEAQRIYNEAAARETQEAQRIKDAEAEAERVKTAAATAAENARAEEKRKADAAIAELERAHQAELKAAQDAAAEQARQTKAAEDKRIEDARIEQERKDKEARAAAELARNRDHRNAIMTIVKTDLMAEAGLDEAAARRVVLSIAKRKIRRASIDF